MTVKNGWHTISGYTVYVDNGLVKRGIGAGVAKYPYRKCRNGGWDKDTNMTVAAFNAAVRRDTARMM